MVLRAALTARRFVTAVKGVEGAYRIPGWPPVRPTGPGRRPAPRGRTARTAAKVVRLRVAQRVLMGFLDPVDDALFLTAGLRRLGVPATFHLGRELVPAGSAAGFYAWVQCGDAVVSTSLPVRETYCEVHRSGRG